MAEPSLTESFVEIACCDEETAMKYLQKNSGDMMKALSRFYADQEKKWDEPASDGPRTQPVGAGGEEREEKEKEKEKHKKVNGNVLMSNGKNEKEEAEEKENGEHQRPRSKAEVVSKKRSLEEHGHLDPSLPWNKAKFMGNGNELDLGNYETVEYDSVKSKIQQTNYQGPQDGSTWHWFLVADQKVFPTDNDDNANGAAATTEGAEPAPVKSATTHISGSKFQSGWSRDPKEKIAETTLRNRQASMVQCILEDKLSSYGKHRGGCKPGYRHRWQYADSEWGRSGSAANHETSECFWDEQKVEDRWQINVHMNWDVPAGTPDKIECGVFMIIGDQRASKLNKNQYETSLRGRRWKIGSLNDSDEEIDKARRQLLQLYLPDLQSKVQPPKKKAKKSA